MNKRKVIIGLLIFICFTLVLIIIHINKGKSISNMTNTSVIISPTFSPISGSDSRYPWHTNIVATTFWVGEIFDPDVPDGSQTISTYDDRWLEHYGGCDGVTIDNSCETEVRTPDNNYFPTQIIPKENPFYLDIPYDDIHDPIGFSMREKVIPWSTDEPYRLFQGDSTFSYMKNRWVEIYNPLTNKTCFGQIEDAGPSSGNEYHDAEYVFGSKDSRPKNMLFNNAGMDVSPALNACLGFTSLNGNDDRINWRFVEYNDVPGGAWKILVTNSPVFEN